MYWFVFSLGGAALGVIIPVGYFSFMLYSVMSQPPLPPGTGGCGMAMLGGIVALLSAPLWSALFAIAGSLLGAMVDIAVLVSHRMADGSE